MARTTARLPRDFEKGLATVDACLRIVRACRLGRGLKFWALENPTGYLRQFLGAPPFTFNPYDFGSPWTKATDLWGYYRRPEFSYTPPTHNLDEALALIRSLPAARGIRSESALRAITPPGFAWEFYKANR